ncbi:MAG: permease prefix domain 1-containing protein [Propioniciclava sp.]
MNESTPSPAGTPGVGSAQPPAVPAVEGAADENRPLESQWLQWRAYLAAREGVDADDVAELEDHLTAQIEDLTAQGLAADEAFLVAVKRLGSHSVLAADFARENAEAFWKQLVVADGSEKTRSDPAGFRPMIGFAVAAGLVVIAAFRVGNHVPEIPLPAMAAGALLGLFAVLSGYFVWLRRPRAWAGAAVAFTLALLLVAATIGYPYLAPGPATTQLLALIHLPVALLLLGGVSYLGDRWRTLTRWMDYLRFVGEWVIYLALIALGAQVLLGLAAGLFVLIGLDPSSVLGEWALPAGLGGTLVVSAWLVEAKKSIVENLAPVLTMVFTPLFVLLLVALFAAMLSVGDLTKADRGLLILVDLLLVVVWGLVLFATSARAEAARPRPFDWLQLGLLVSALAVDLLVLVAMAGRIGEFGASPNKVAALGENLVIAVNLVGALWLQARFLGGQIAVDALRTWQCRYLPVIGVWATVVVVVFPPIFGFR